MLSELERSLAGVFCLLSPLLCVGCAGEVQATVTVTPAPAIAMPAPPPDTDGDGVVDGSDQCANEKEDGLAPDDKDGCPLKDVDGDGVLASDKCPQEAETKNGYEDDDGCPDEAPEVYLSGDRVVMQKTIKFGFGGSLSSGSKPTIDAFAALLQKHSKIELLEVGAHLNPSKPSGLDASTSRSRASSVVDALVKAGVNRKRLRSTGYGNKCSGSGASKKVKVKRDAVLIQGVVVRRGGADTNAVAGCGPKPPA